LKTKNSVFILNAVMVIGIAFSSYASNTKTIIVGEDILSEFRVKDKDKNRRYIINKEIDLETKNLELSPKVILIFEKGLIRNGSITGDSTQILAGKDPIFDNIKLEGSWKLSEISTDMFLTIDDEIAANISTLSSDKQYNKIIINQDLKIPIKPWDSYFVIKSNTDLILNADLFTLPTRLKGGYCINVKGTNVTIEGNNHFLFGTLPSPYQQECFEWLHGLNIDSGTLNVKVENLNSWLFCGDGFYNSGSNVTFNNVNAKFNGRQGMSITNGRNIIVKNSSFTHTGYYRICTSNGPGAGIDIEPNEGDTVNNIKIDNCSIINNYRNKYGFVNDLEFFNAKKADVTVTNSDIGGLSFGKCSHIRFNNCPNIKTVVGINEDIHSICVYYSIMPLLSKSAQGRIELIKQKD